MKLTINRILCLLFCLFIISKLNAQTYSLVGIARDAASTTIGGNCVVAVATGGTGTKCWQGSTVATASHISSTTGDVAAGCGSSTGLRLEMSGAGNSSGTGAWNNTTTVTFTFIVPVQAPVTFNLYDLTETYYNDGTSNYAYYQDKVTIRATDDLGVAVLPSATTSGSVDNVVSGTDRILVANLITAQCANQQITIGTGCAKIKTVTVVYGSQDPPTHIPIPVGSPPRYGISQYQYIFISNINYIIPPTLTLTPSPAVLCLGASSTLTATAGFTNYAWSSGSSGASNTTTVTPAVLGTTTYTVTATNALGCTYIATTTVTANTSTIPTFNSVGPYCQGALAPALPTTSINGIMGTWSPALSTTTAGTTTYTFTPNVGQCAVNQTMSIIINSSPLVSATALPSTICSGGSSTLAASCSSGCTGITYTWSPSAGLSVTTGSSVTANPGTSQTYTLTGTANGCSGTANVSLIVTPTVVPAFNALGPYCVGSISGTLPTTSNNGINGTWSPTTISTATTGVTTYTFTPNAGQCATVTTMIVAINSSITPTFVVVGPYCSGDAISALPITSTNGITGSWSPGINNILTTTYTFTPNVGQCASLTTLTITINPIITPIFSAVGPFCSGAVISALPTTSTNGITGSWGPAINNLSTTTYTFTPSVGQCATTSTMNVVINSSAIPNFVAVGPYCTGATIAALPTTSTNGIIGSWSPVINNTTTTTYTFTPTVSQCATTITMTIVIGSSITPVFTSVGPYCSGASISALPTTSTNGITGSWSPAINNIATTTYTFTPNPNQCAVTTTINIVINSLPTANVNSSSICSGQSTTLTANGGTSYVWDNSLGIINPVVVAPNITTTYHVTVTDANNCTSSATSIITVNTNLTPSITGIANICQGQSTILDAGGPYNTYLWSTNASSQTINVNTAGNYSVTVTNGVGCSGTANATVIVNLLPNISAGSPQPITCLNAITIVSASSTSSNINWLWSTGVSPLNTNSGSVTNSGTYNITVTDNTTGCTNNTSVIVSSNITQPNISMGVSPTLTCALPMGTVSASSTITGVSWLWSSGVSPNNNSSGTVSSAGTYIVTVTDQANGCTNTGSLAVTASALLPNLTMGTSSTINCTSTTAAVSANSNTPGATWFWTGPGSITPNNASSGTVNIPGNYTVVVTNPTSGCTTSGNIIVLQNNTVPDVSISNPSIISCTTTQINLVANSTISGLSYFWNGTGIVSGASSSVAAVNQAGAYSVIVTNPLNGCTNTTNVNVIYTANTISSTIAVNGLSCNGQVNGNVNLTVNGGTMPFTFVWNNGALIEDLSGVSAGNYLVTITDVNGCTNTNAVVFTQPAPFYVSTNPDFTICTNQSAMLNISTTGGTFPYSYQWSNGSTNINIPINPASNTTYSVTATDSNGCTTSTSVNVSIPQPLSLNLTQSTDSICLGESLLITPVVSGGMPPYTFVDQNGGALSVPIFTYPNHTGGYSIGVIDACGTAFLNSVYVEVLPSPLSGATYDDGAGCQPFTVNFNSINENGNYSYLWDFGDNENLSLSPYPVHVYHESGQFDVTLTVINQYGCQSIYYYDNWITVYPKPHAQFEWNPEFASIIHPIIQFINQTTNAVGYEWSFGDGDSSSFVNPSHTYPNAGSWPVQLIAVSNMGCYDTVEYPVVIKEEWTFYAPSAFSPDFDRNNDVFFALAHGINETDFSFGIYDRWGEIIWSTDKYYSDTEKSEAWDGRAKNHDIVPVGTYTWLAKFKDFKNISHVKAGAVTVIR